MDAARRAGGLQNEFSWSNSRNETFLECLRRYYYHYYAYWGGWRADAPPLVRRLYVLRNLKNRHLWVGSVVHDTVAAVLQHVRGGLEPPDAEQVAADAVADMRSGFRQSRQGAYVDDPKRALGLIEHHYREEISDSQWRAGADKVRRCVATFFSSPMLATLRGIPADDWLSIEQLESFALAGAKVFLKMDVAYRESGGGAVIVDWKSGRRPPRPDGLQLGVYALYGCEAWRLEPEAIRVVEANLLIDKTATAQVDAANLAGAREKITGGIEAMRKRLRDPERNHAVAEDFPPAPQARRCIRCPFREVCSASGDVLAPRERASLAGSITV